MDRSFSIKIKKRTFPEWLCFLLIALPFLFGTLFDLMGLPGLFKYLLDIAWLTGLVMLFLLRNGQPLKEIRNLLVWAVLFLLYTFVLYIPKYQSGLYYLWGVRNNFRYYVAFAAFCVFLKPRDVDHYLGLFDKVFWIHIAVSLVQYFALGKNQDYLGGIFGVTKGCNGYSNIFCVIVLTKTIIFYLEKKEKISSCVLKFAAAVVISALAELKFFFVEAIAILVMATLFTNFTWRKVGFIITGVAAVFAGVFLLEVLFPEFSGFFSLEQLLAITSSDKGYTSSGDLNRLTAIPMINERFLDSWDLQLFGFGLGNCDNATYDFLTTPFFVKYSWMHYTWLSTAYMYLETGWIGLVFYFVFFVLAFCKIWQLEKNSDTHIKPYCRIARIMAVLCVGIAIYNASLRTEAGYMAYFVLAIPFAVSKGQKAQ